MVLPPPPLSGASAPTEYQQPVAAGAALEVVHDPLVAQAQREADIWTAGIGRWRGCHAADTLSPPLLNRLAKGRGGGAAE